MRRTENLNTDKSNADYATSTRLFANPTKSDGVDAAKATQFSVPQHQPRSGWRRG
ncbi:MAG: hypothetical protein ACLS6O_01500 [Bifidobacterium sp.]